MSKIDTSHKDFPIHFHKDFFVNSPRYISPAFSATNNGDRHGLRICRRVKGDNFFLHLSSEISSDG